MSWELQRSVQEERCFLQSTVSAFAKQKDSNVSPILCMSTSFLLMFVVVFFIHSDLNKRQLPMSAAPGSNNPFRKVEKQTFPRRDIASQSGRW